MRSLALPLAILFFAAPVVAQTSPAQAALEAWRNYDYPEAERLYREALAKEPNSPEATAGLVRTLLAEKKLTAAEGQLAVILRSQPDAPPLLVAKGELRLREAHLEDAETAFRNAVKLDPTAARGWFGLARIAYMNSMHRTAKRLVDKAHDLDPADPEIYDWWAARLPRAERRRAIEYMVDHHGNMAPDRLNNLQSRLAWLIVLGNRTAWKMTSNTKSARLKLEHVMTTPRWPGEYSAAPMRVSAVALKVRINDKKTLTLLLDTGASGILLQRGAASKAELKQVYDIAAQGIGDDKAANGYLAWANAVRIDDVAFENVPITVVDQRFSPDTDGLIGLDVFDRFLVTLDIGKGQLDLAPLAELPKDHVDPDGSWDRYVAPEMKEYDPVLHMGPHLLVPTSIDKRPPGLFFLDTGAFDSQVDSNYVDQSKLMPAPNLNIRGISGRVKDAWIAQNVRIQFGHFVQDNFRMIAISMDKLSESEEVALTGILGFPLLSQFRLSIDYRDGLVYFDYKAGKR